MVIVVRKPSPVLAGNVDQRIGWVHSKEQMPHGWMETKQRRLEEFHLHLDIPNFGN